MVEYTGDNMTKDEDHEHGVLTVSVNYQKLGQAIETAIHRLKVVRDMLDVAAIEKKIEDGENDEI